MYQRLSTTIDTNTCKLSTLDVEVPQVKEELVHVKEIIQQKRMGQQMFEQVVEVLIRVTEEEIVPCLK